MYRALLFLTILNIVEPHNPWCNDHPSICHRHHHNYQRLHNHDERIFQHLANVIIEADNKAKRFCNEHQETSKEIYGQNIYKLIASLPNYNVSTIEVKIKHRVVYIKADKEDNRYVNVKILPELLNTSAANWYYGNEEVTVAVPYKVAVATEAVVNCGDEINSDVFDVPKSELDPNEAPQIDMRFSNQTVNENVTVNENGEENVTDNVV